MHGHGLKDSNCDFCGKAAKDVPRLTASPAAAICSDCMARGLQNIVIASQDAEQAKLVDAAPGDCSFCSQTFAAKRMLKGESASICSNCLLVGSENLLSAKEPGKPLAAPSADWRRQFAWFAVANHFDGIATENIVTAVREFPARMRADIQAALDTLFSDTLKDARSLGLAKRYSHDNITFAQLLEQDRDSVKVAPMRFMEVDVGEDEPIRCVENALWLTSANDVPHAILLSLKPSHYGEASTIMIEIAVPPGEESGAIASGYFKRLEQEIAKSASYRGKVLSLESRTPFEGTAAEVRVHRLPTISADDIILPEKTLNMLERNVFGFFEQREDLRRLGLSLRKGLLFHGPPGTGKTHCINYLASRLTGHTTLLITAGQICYLGEYMALARLLQPSIVVIEDADLIARERTTMHDPGAEVLLNRLLNEMDGLQEDAEVLFILTTNRPDELEPALAARPGRIDQAIEFPLPDADSRQRLVDLYAHRLEVADAIRDEAVRRTDGMSAAFIKELMRRTAQYNLARGNGEAVESQDLDMALREMLFEGGQLNVRILGGDVNAGESGN